MEIRYDKEALKALKSYDKPTRERILEKIQGLTQTPPVGDIKQLVGYNNLFRLRVGKYRVVYEYLTTDDNPPIKILLINDIDSRGDIYK